MRKLTSMFAVAALASGVVSTQVNAEDATATTKLLYQNLASVSAGAPIAGSGGNNNTSGGAGSSGGASWDFVTDLGSGENGQMIMRGVTFGVHGTSQRLKIACAATDLYKGGVLVDVDDPNINLDPSFMPIPLKTDDTTIDPGNLASLELSTESDNVVGYIDEFEWNGFPFYKTEGVNFHGQNGQLSTNFTCNHVWNNAAPEQAAGEYGGYAKIFVIPLPPLGV